MTSFTLTPVASSGISTSPRLVLGYSAARTSRTILHQVLGRGDPVITSNIPKRRSGTFELLYTSREQAVYAHQSFCAFPGDWVYLDTDNSIGNMTFVIGEGDLTIELDPETRRNYIVTIPFQEIAG